MNESIGNRISRYRKSRALTQEELASQLGVSAQAVSKWENDISCPDIALLPQLCRLLGITTDELLTGKTGEVKMLPPSQRKSMDELTLRIYVRSGDGDVVKVNVPMSMAKLCMELGLDIGMGNQEAVKNIDYGRIMALVEQGAIGKLVEIETADGDTVEVVVE